MMPFPLFNQGCPTPIKLLSMIFNLRVPHNRYRNLPIKINIPITIRPMNLRSATAREKVDRIPGLTIPWNETNPITISLLFLTNTPYLSQLRDLQGQHPFKLRASPAARSEDSTITRELAPGRTSVGTDLRETVPFIT